MLDWFKQFWFDLVHRGSDGYYQCLDEWVIAKVDYNRGKWTHSDWINLLDILHTKFWYPIHDDDMNRMTGEYIECKRKELLSSKSCCDSGH